MVARGGLGSPVLRLSRRLCLRCFCLSGHTSHWKGFAVAAVVVLIGISAEYWREQRPQHSRTEKEAQIVTIARQNKLTATEEHSSQLTTDDPIEEWSQD